jgi:hypothetical protein
VPSIAPGFSPGGYIPLDLFGIPPTPIGDEEIVNFNVLGFRYDGVTYTRLGVDSNGYLVVGGGNGSEDNNCCALTQIPDPARPNNVLAPFWTDLDGGGMPGVFTATLTDGTNSWIVIEWRVNVFGTTSARNFQVWLGINGTQDISFTYDPATLAPPFGRPFLIGAENETGTGGAQLPSGQLPAGDLVVTSTDPVPGGSTSYTMTIRGDTAGSGVVTNSMVTPLVPGTTVVRNTITVN